MLKLVDYQIAMANAQIKVKRLAKQVIRSNEENGVGYGIHQFLMDK